MKIKQFMWLLAVASALFSCQKEEEIKPTIKTNQKQEFSGFAKETKINTKPHENERKTIIGNPQLPEGSYYRDIQISVIDYTPIGIIFPMTFTVRIIYTKDQNGKITSVQNVESGLAGTTVGSNWSMNDWAAVVNGNKIWFELHGKFSVDIFYEGVGTVYKRNIISNGYLNIETGEFITTWTTDDNTTPGVLHNWNQNQPANGTYAPYNSGGGGGGDSTGGGIGGGWQGGGDGGGWSGGWNGGGGNGGGTGGGGGNGGNGGNGDSGADDGTDDPESTPPDQVAKPNPDNSVPMQ